MIRLRVILLTNTRIGGAHRTFQKGPVLVPGQLIDVHSEVRGEAIGANDRWYFDGTRHFIWSGGLERAEPAAPGFVRGLAVETPELKPAKEAQPWFNQLLRVPELWKLYGTRGEGVTVAVLDSGADKHNPDLAPNIRQMENLIDHAPSALDAFGHGTACAALVGCANSGGRNIGVAPDCRLLIGKITHAGEIRGFESIKRGISWAVDNGADIISLSFGKKSVDAAEVLDLYAHIDAVTRGREVLIFASCGNNFSPAPVSGITYPSAFSSEVPLIGKPGLDRLLSIGAVDQQGLLSGVTLRNDHTELCAPGVDILTYGLNGTTGLNTGTSMATPIAAGLAVLALAHCRKKGKALKPQQLKALLSASGTALTGHAALKRIDGMQLFQKL